MAHAPQPEPNGSAAGPKEEVGAGSRAPWGWGRREKRRGPWGSAG